MKFRVARFCEKSTRAQCVYTAWLFVCALLNVQRTRFSIFACLGASGFVDHELGTQCGYNGQARAILIIDVACRHDETLDANITVQEVPCSEIQLDSFQIALRIAVCVSWPKRVQIDSRGLPTIACVSRH